MFRSWFNTKSGIVSNKIGFEDVIYAIKHNETHLLINTLPATYSDQECLILHTISCNSEEQIINDLVKQYALDKIIIIYGKNAADSSTDQKYQQLRGFGFYNVLIYSGGLFEWLLLQDIYGFDEFPTTKKILDILKYKPTSTFSRPRIGY